MPRPLDELRARARILRGVFCDIDDTLTHQGALVADAYAALVELGRAGLRVVPVTGRPAGWAATLAALWPVDAVVAENGAVAYVRERAADGRARFAPRYWDEPKVRDAQQLRLAALRDQVLSQWPWAKLADDQWLRVCDLAFDIGERQSLDQARVAELSRALEGAGAHCLISSVHAHAYFGDHDKARMLVRLAGELWSEDLEGPARDHYLFIGDSPNDASGFAHFPNSAGPANAARWQMTHGPAFLAPSEGGHGFAEIARVVLDGRS